MTDIWLLPALQDQPEDTRHLVGRLWEHLTAHWSRERTLTGAEVRFGNHPVINPESTMVLDIVQPV